VRVRAVLKKSWDAWADDMAEVPGDGRECARWSTAGTGKAELTAQAHGAEREDGRAREGVAADRRNPHVRRRGHAAWLGRARPARLLCLFPFSSIS
jgi:hypothetical protein